MKGEFSFEACLIGSDQQKARHRQRILPLELLHCVNAASAANAVRCKSLMTGPRVIVLLHVLFRRCPSR